MSEIKNLSSYAAEEYKTEVERSSAETVGNNESGTGGKQVHRWHDAPGGR